MHLIALIKMCKELVLMAKKVGDYFRRSAKTWWHCGDDVMCGKSSRISWECHRGGCSDLEEWLGVVLVPMSH